MGKDTPTPETEIPEADKAAYFGALCSMAAADGSMDAEELELIFDSLDMEGLSARKRAIIRSYMFNPPRLEDCLFLLRESSDTVRLGMVIALVDVALADDVIVDGERRALEHTRTSLGVETPLFRAVEVFGREMKRLRDRSLDDSDAVASIKTAVDELKSVGVPVSAVKISGTAARLNAAGLRRAPKSSGIAPSSRGAGLAGLFSRLFGGGGKAKAAGDAEREQQLVVEHLQTTLDDLNVKLAQLEAASEEESDIDREERLEKIDELQARIAPLTALLEKRAPASPPDEADA